MACPATRLLRIPRIGYFDDFGLMTPLPMIEGARRDFSEFDDIYGPICKLSTSELEWLLEFLGPEVCLSPFPAGLPPPFLSVAQRDKC